MKSRRVLVDGAGGFVGRHVVDELSRRGYAVRATDRPGTPIPEKEGVERRFCDLQAAPFDDLLDGITDIVHVAGLFDLAAKREHLFAANVGLTERVATAASLRNLRFVHISSVTVYGRPRRTPVREDARQKPISPYEQSKQAGERIVLGLARDGGLRATVLRPSGIYGPWGRYGLAVIASAYSLALDRGHLDGIPPYRGGTSMTHAHVEDVASAVACVLEREEAIGRAFNIADDTPTPWGDLLGTIEDALGFPPRKRIPISNFRARWIARGWRLLPESRRERLNRSLERRWNALIEREKLLPMLLPRLDRHAYDYWLADHVYANDALKRLGWAPRHPNVQSGIRETIAWYVENRWLPPGRSD